MAAQVLDHPQSSLLRSALAHAAGELIRVQGDAAVLRAIDLASDLKVAQAIRHAAEAACEAVSTSSHGVERQARLFSIAVVVRFAEALTDREFGELLVPILDAGSLLARVQECTAHNRARSLIWPRVWGFDDLSRLSFSDVRHITIMASTAGTAGNGSMALRFPPNASAQRRCATFLRYLVGYQIGSHITLEQSRDRQRFTDCVRGVVRAGLADAQNVAVIYDGCFYGPLWHGLRLYQGCRLADVATTLTAQGSRASELAASAAFMEARNDATATAQLAFLRSGRKLDRHVYSILLEPQTDPSTALARVVAPLRSLGVKVHFAREAMTARISPTLEHERCARRSVAAFELTLPL